MNDPFDELSFEKEINPAHWTEETRLHTPTKEFTPRTNIISGAHVTFRHSFFFTRVMPRQIRAAFVRPARQPCALS